MRRVRLNIEISITTLRKLILWAHTRDASKSNWARTVLILRCDTNEEKVRSWYDKEAEKLGMTREELEDWVLRKEGFNYTREDYLGEDN